ncbi:hypothetical protein Tco_0632619 [Tanacetum coccineum]
MSSNIFKTSEYHIHDGEDIACMRAACDIYFTEFDNHLLKIVIEPSVITYEDDKAVRQMIINARALKVYAHQSMSMDKVSVLEDASNYIKELQGRVLELKGSPGTKRKHVHKSVIFVKGSKRSASDDEYYLSDYKNSEVGSTVTLTYFPCDQLFLFDALLVSLLLTAKSSHQSAGIVKQALFSIAQCVVVLCLATKDYNCSSTREEDQLEWKNKLRKLQNIMLRIITSPFNLGRMIEEINKDETLNLVKSRELGKSHDTVKHKMESDHDDDDRTLAETLLNIKKSAAKGKAIMQEFEPLKKIKKKEMIQISLNEEFAKSFYEEEQAQILQDEVYAKQVEAQWIADEERIP